MTKVNLCHSLLSLLLCRKSSKWVFVSVLPNGYIFNCLHVRKSSICSVQYNISICCCMLHGILSVCVKSFNTSGQGAKASTGARNRGDHEGKRGGLTHTKLPHSLSKWQKCWHRRSEQIVIQYRELVFQSYVPSMCIFLFAEARKKYSASSWGWQSRTHATMWSETLLVALLLFRSRLCTHMILPV